MKILIIIIASLLPFVKVQAQLPSEKNFSLEKILSYKKGGTSNQFQTTITSLPSEAKEYPIQVERTKMMLKKVAKSIEPKLQSLPSARKPDFHALIRKYKKI